MEISRDGLFRFTPRFKIEKIALNKKQGLVEFLRASKQL